MMTAAVKDVFPMKRIFIAVLLSALIGPGVGQLYNKDFKKAKFLIIGSIIIFILIFLFFGAVSRAFINMMPTGFNPASFDNMALVQQNIEKLYSKHPEPFYMFNIVISILIILWIYGVIDAFNGARKRIKQDPHS